VIVKVYKFKIYNLISDHKLNELQSYNQKNLTWHVIVTHIYAPKSENMSSDKNCQ
jgi:hypothetical protein